MTFLAQGPKVWVSLHLTRRGKAVKPRQKRRKELMVCESTQCNGSQAWVQLAQRSGMLLVHCRGYHKDSVLDSNEVGDVHEGLVHPGVGGDVVGGQEGCKVVHHVLGVVTECDHRQHHLQPY